MATPAAVVTPSNDSQVGAKMAALEGQMQAAASQGAQYVTVLMGANDLCTPTAASMTPTATFKAQFSQAMSDFIAADPGAHVFVASIPNIFQLWNTMHTNLVAEATWTLARICQSMLGPLDTAAQRQQVVDQELADNAVSASVLRGAPRLPGGTTTRCSTSSPGRGCERDRLRRRWGSGPAKGVGCRRLGGWLLARVPLAAVVEPPRSVRRLLALAIMVGDGAPHLRSVGARHRPADL